MCFCTLSRILSKAAVNVRRKYMNKKNNEDIIQLPNTTPKSWKPWNHNLLKYQLRYCRPMYIIIHYAFSHAIYLQKTVCKPKHILYSLVCSNADPKSWLCTIPSGQKEDKTNLIFRLNELQFKLVSKELENTEPEMRKHDLRLSKLSASLKQSKQSRRV